LAVTDKVVAVWGTNVESCHIDAVLLAAYCYVHPSVVWQQQNSVTIIMQIAGISSAHLSTAISWCLEGRQEWTASQITQWWS